MQSLTTYKSIFNPPKNIQPQFKAQNLCSTGSNGKKMKYFVHKTRNTCNAMQSKIFDAI